MAVFPPRHLLLRTEPRPDQIPIQRLFIALHSISLILLTSLTIIILLAKLQRHPVLFSLFAAYSLNDILNLLVSHQPLYTNWGLCLISQAGTTAGTACATTATMSLVAYTWSLLMSRAEKKVLSDRFLFPLLICLPWVVALLVFVISIVSTSMRPDDLYVTVLTCYAQNIYTDLLHVVSVIAVLAALVFDVWGIVLFAQNYFQTRSFGSQVDTQVANIVVRPQLNRTFTLRVLIFGLAVVAALAVAIVIIVRPSSHAPALFQSSIGLICFALFGTQRDVYEAVKIPFSSTGRLLHKLSCSSSSSDTFFDDKSPQDTLPPLPPNPPPSGATTPERRRRFSRSSGRMSFGAMFRSAGRVEERREVPTVTAEEVKEESLRKGSDASKESGKEGENIELEGEMVSVAVLLSASGYEERPPMVAGSSDGSASSEASNPSPSS